MDLLHEEHTIALSWIARAVGRKVGPGSKNFATISNGRADDGHRPSLGCAAGGKTQKPARVPPGPSLKRVQKNRPRQGVWLAVRGPRRKIRGVKVVGLACSGVSWHSGASSGLYPCRTQTGARVRGRQRHHLTGPRCRGKRKAPVKGPVEVISSRPGEARRRRGGLPEPQKGIGSAPIPCSPRTSPNGPPPLAALAADGVAGTSSSPPTLRR